MSTTVPVQQMPRFPGLDSLRAIASIAVVATHTSFWAGVYGHGTLGSATQRLEVGVSVFFVLSGFLLSYPYLRGLRTGQTHDSTARYLWKRGLRILPVYWVTVVAAMVLLDENRSLGPGRWIDNLLLVDLYTHGTLPHGLTQMWSLTTEVAFYLVLPALMWIFARTLTKVTWSVPRLMSGLAVMSAIALAWTYVAGLGLSAIDEWSRRALPGYLLWFAAGIALAVLDVDRRNRHKPSSSRTLHVLMGFAASPGTCWLAAAALFVIASTPVAGSPGLVAQGAGEGVVRSALYAAVAALVVLPSVLGDPRSSYARALAHPVLRHLGRTSYSLFCCHVIVLEIASGFFGFELFRSNPFVVFGVTLAISLVVAEALYRLVELPFLRLKYARRRSTPGSPTAATEPTASSTRS